MVVKLLLVVLMAVMMPSTESTLLRRLHQLAGTKNARATAANNNDLNMIEPSRFFRTMK